MAKIIPKFFKSWLRGMLLRFATSVIIGNWWQGEGKDAFPFYHKFHLKIYVGNVKRWSMKFWHISSFTVQNYMCSGNKEQLFVSFNSIKSKLWSKFIWWIGKSSIFNVMTFLLGNEWAEKIKWVFHNLYKYLTNVMKHILFIKHYFLVILVKNCQFVRALN